MLLLRLAAVLVVLVTVASLVLFLVTRDRRYLRFAMRVLTYALLVALLVFGLLILERVVVLV
jgi:hypothetical protein